MRAAYCGQAANATAPNSTTRKRLGVRFGEVSAFAGMTEWNFGISSGPSPTGWVQKDHDHNSGQSNPITRIPPYSGHEYHERPGVLLSHRHGHRRRRADVRRQPFPGKRHAGRPRHHVRHRQRVLRDLRRLRRIRGPVHLALHLPAGQPGRVYVSDEQLHRISVFDREGALLST